MWCGSEEGPLTYLDMLSYKFPFYKILENCNNWATLTFWRRNFFFFILARPVYKMWKIQEPNMLELWNKLHFEEKKGEYIPCLKYAVFIFVE